MKAFGDCMTDEYLKDVCKLGQGEACCRYIGVGIGRGFWCAKSDPELKKTIDQLVHNMNAQGDNCSADPNPEIHPK